MKLRNLIVVVIVLVLAGAAIYEQVYARQAKEATGSFSMDEPAAEHLSKPAPSFELQGLDGKSHKVGGAGDKPVIVNFWASWCGPCHEEAPDLQKLYEQYGSEVDFYAVNVTKGDTVEKAKEFVSQYKMTIPALVDTKGDVADQYRILFIPTSFLIDKSGTIREVVHVLPKDQWELKLKKLLKS